MKFRSISLSIVLSISIALSGCNYQQDAQRTANVIAAVIAVAKVEAQVVPVADQVAYNNFLAALTTIDGQLNTCVAAAKGMGATRKSTFLACFNTFATGLTTPAELAQLRILDKGVQGKVALYVVGIVAGVNVALSFFGGPAVAPPVAGPVPTAGELRDLCHQVGCPTQFLENGQ